MHRCLSVCVIDEPAFCLETSSREGLCWILRETVLVDDYQMELVLQEVCAGRASMAIVNREIAALRPIRDVFAIGWLCHVQDNGDSILVIIPLDALMGVGRVRSYQPMRFRSKFCQFVVFQWVLLGLGNSEIDI